MAWKSSKTKDQAPDRTAAIPARGQAAGGSPDSLIAAGMVLDGDCRTEGPLRVDGHVTGDVHAARLTVGPGGRVDGNVTGQGAGGGEHTVVIEGRVEGAVEAPHVQVGPQGAIGGGMKVKDAVVRGRVAGGIHTEGRLLLEATAVVEGDVTARRLGLSEGGQVFGTIRIGDRPSGSQSSQSSQSSPSGSGEGK